MNSKYMLFAMLMVVVGASAFGQSTIQINQSVRSSISIYIPNAIINGSTYYSMAYFGSNFIVMQTGNNYIVINGTAPYSIIANNKTITPLLREFILNKYALNQSTLNALKYNVSAFVSNGAKSIAQCLENTGLNGSYTCTTANYCYSCQTVSACSGYLSNTSTQPVIENAIINFSKIYDSYNSSYSNFTKLESKINNTNYYNYINALTNNASGIINTPQALQRNPLFPPPAGFDMALFKNCPVFVSLSSPWYCQLLSFCNTLTFNNTLANNAKSNINKINALPVSNSSINLIVRNSTALAQSYLGPVIIRVNTSIYDNVLLNKTFKLYNATIKNASYIDSKVYNAGMYALVSTMQNTFNSIKSKGIYQNITAANITLSSLMKRVNEYYSNISSVYTVAYNAVEASSGIVLSKQLDYPYDNNVAALATSSSALLATFNNRINYSNLSAITSQANAISSNASKYGTPFSMPNVVKSIDSFFVMPLAGISASNIMSRNAIAPLYAGLLSFIIGIIIIGIIYQLTYVKLHKRHKLKVSRNVRNAWIKMFAIFFVIVLIYVYITYALASSANNSLPVDNFISIYNHSSNVAIIVNRSSEINASVTSCINSITASAKLAKKNVTIINEKNLVCSVTNSTGFANPNCINSVVGTGEPSILISENNSNYIIYKGMYGNILYAGGVPTSTNSCYLSSILK